MEAGVYWKLVKLRPKQGAGGLAPPVSWPAVAFQRAYGRGIIF